MKLPPVLARWWATPPALAAAPRWRHGVRWFESRTRRERVILILGGVSLVWAAADAVWLGPALQRHQLAVAESRGRAIQHQVSQSEATALAQEIRLLDQTESQQIAAARARAAAAQQTLLTSQSGLVGAQQMLPLLHELLRQRCPAERGCATRLRVRSARTLTADELSAATAPTTAAAPGAAASGAAASPSAVAEVALPGLWKHGVEIVLEGNFVDIAAYVERLEALPQRWLRGGMHFSVEHHPRATLTLRLYTLSLDAGWLEL